jgi:long-chain acyl-CoA synthetase
LITSYGRNIAPEWVESVLLGEPAIAQALVVGDGEPWLAAVLVAVARRRPRRTRCCRPARQCQTLPDYARIGRLALACTRSPRNGLATGNGRPIRAAILRSPCRRPGCPVSAMRKPADVVP